MERVGAIRTVPFVARAMPASLRFEFPIRLIGIRYAGNYVHPEGVSTVLRKGLASRTASLVGARPAGQARPDERLPGLLNFGRLSQTQFSQAEQFSTARTVYPEANEIQPSRHPPEGSTLRREHPGVPRRAGVP